MNEDARTGVKEQGRRRSGKDGETTWSKKDNIITTVNAKEDEGR